MSKEQPDPVRWATSRLVAHVAWTVGPRFGVVIDPGLDWAVARELDRRIPVPKKGKKVT
jgi:hypothetical protein